MAHRSNGFVSEHHGRGCAPVSTERNHTNTRDQSILGGCDLSLSALAQQLAHRLDEVEATPGQTGLTGGKLATTGIERQLTFIGKVGSVHELRARTRFTEPDLFELQQDGDEEIVVGV